MTTMLLSEIFPPKNGGSGRWFWEMYRRLPRDQYLAAVGEDPRQDEFDRTHDMRIARLPLSWGDLGLLSPNGVMGYTRAFRRLAKIVKTEGIRDIHCGRCIPCGWLGMMLKFWCGTKYLCYVHGEEVNLDSTGDHSGVMSSRQIRWMARQAFRHADLLIANSMNSQRILLEQWGIPAEKVKVLYPGMDAERFVPAPRESVERERLGWHDRPVILTVGRLQKRKGQDIMIQAMKELRRDFPNLLYSIVGDGEERAALENLVRQEQLQDCVQFMGEPNDNTLIRAYQQCDLFVLPNRQVGKDIEGFGMVLVEAQACGKPVIAGASGGTRETMDIPTTGLTIPCEHPEPLIAAIRELLHDPERMTQMGAAARPWVVEQFDWEAVTRRARKLFGTPAPSPAVPKMNVHAPSAS